MSYPSAFLNVAAAILLSGCWGGYYPDSGSTSWDTDGGGSGGCTLTGTGFGCDEDASWTDDQFWFAATASGSPSRVWVEVGGHTVDLDYDSEYGQWGKLVWADEIGSDCDEVNTISVQFKCN